MALNSSMFKFAVGTVALLSIYYILRRKPREAMRKEDLDLDLNLQQYDIDLLVNYIRREHDAGSSSSDSSD